MKQLIVTVAVAIDLADSLFPEGEKTAATADFSIPLLLPWALSPSESAD